MFHHIFTARKRSCVKVMFLHMSVILFTGGVLCPGRGGLCQGGSLTGGLCPGGSLSKGGLCQGDPPPYGKEREVRILLEYILVLDRHKERNSGSRTLSGC